MKSMVVAASANADAGREGSTRERLLRVAIELFAERGYAATGVDALCRRAGVAKTGLYWEFQNKAGLLMAVIDRVVADWTNAVEDATRAVGPSQRLELALTAIRRRIREQPELFRLILVVLAERTQVDDEARDAMRRFFEVARDSLAREIQERSGRTLPAADLRAVAELVLAMIEGVLLRAQIYGDEAEVDAPFEALQRAVVLLVADLVAKAGRESPVQIFDLAKPTA